MGALRPGYEVTSEITLVRRLGAGGMGTVWLANHGKLRTEVVVKFLSEALAADPDACARFEREVHATLQVRSPHVVQTLDHGITESGIPYLVMEWLEGHDLAKEMRVQKQLPADQAMHVIEGVATALTKAHERGIVHRDIKPANVFLVTASPRPFVKLVDFGIAKRLEDETMTATNALLGTPAYMSPEQMDGVAAIDARTDLWALGVLVFHMLTGQAPFRGNHIANIAHSIMHGERPRISTHRPDLPPALDGWIEKALARNPEERFGTARELADTLALAFGDFLTTANRRQFQPPTGPQLPTGMQLSAPPAVGPSHNPPSQTVYSGEVGVTLGPTANTHSPYGRSPRLKWGVMGVAALGVVLVGLSFKVGYGLRPAAPPAVASEAPPPPAAPVPAPVVAPAPVVSATASTPIPATPASVAPPAPPTRPTKRTLVKSGGKTRPSSSAAPNETDDVGF